MTEDFPIVVFGGRSLVGPYLFKHMSDAGLTATVISRHKMELPSGFRHMHIDVNKCKEVIAPPHSIVISLAPIWVLARNLKRFSGAHEVIAMSSTSRYSKAKSDDPVERELSENIEMAEDIVMAWEIISGTRCTILRSNMIYDGVNDGNVARIAGLIKRIRIFPLAGTGAGLRQPIHADDAAAAIMGAMGNSAAYGKAMNIGGGQVLTYSEMVRAIFCANGQRPAFISLPIWIMKWAFDIARSIGIFGNSSTGRNMFQRMNEDLVFDCADGLKILGYSPREFTPGKL